MSRGLIVAIDGPGGAGKSTLGRMLARKLGLVYLDTGAMYRAAALAVIQSGTDAADSEQVVDITRCSKIDFQDDAGTRRIILNGSDVTDEIRSDSISRVASLVSRIPGVRQELVARQRSLGAKGGVIVDGRDAGTVVFPDAQVKFFLTAVPEERARRRFEEERVTFASSDYSGTLADLNIRDERDSTRADSPLRIAEDATVIDTTELSIEAVFQRMLEVISEKKRAQNSAAGSQ